MRESAWPGIRGVLVVVRDHDIHSSEVRDVHAGHFEDRRRRYLGMPSHEIHPNLCRKSGYAFSTKVIMITNNAKATDDLSGLGTVWCRDPLQLLKGFRPMLTRRLLHAQQC